eukprot:8435224-Pyramimonas_sp.AAC.1
MRDHASDDCDDIGPAAIARATGSTIRHDGTDERQEDVLEPWKEFYEGPCTLPWRAPGVHEWRTGP